jgi:hypothetical protein
VSISRGTFARDNKLRVSIKADEMQQLLSRFETIATQAMSSILGKPVLFEVVRQNWNVAASYLGTCVQEKWLQHDLVRDLMRYDFYSRDTLQETIEHMTIEDVLWLEFWCTELPDLSADEVWCLMSFLMSHTFPEDRTLTIGVFCKAQCTDERWRWYNSTRRGENTRSTPPPHGLGDHFTDLPPWCVQTHVGPGQIPADQCIIFDKNVGAGEPLLYDYGANYFLSPDKQLCKTCPAELRPVLFHIAGRFDPRVAEALEAHMRA